MSIEVKTLTERDEGREVVFAPPWGPAEEGVIDSWNERYVYVLYRRQSEAHATSPDYLEFARK